MTASGPVDGQCARAHCGTGRDGTGRDGTGRDTMGAGKRAKNRAWARSTLPPPCLEGGALGTWGARAGFGLNPRPLVI